MNEGSKGPIPLVKLDKDQNSSIIKNSSHFELTYLNKSGKGVSLNFKKRGGNFIELING